MPQRNSFPVYYPPQAPCRDTAVVVCPGGGYRFLSDREGAPVAMAFSRMGYHAYVVSYTVEQPPLGTRPVRELSAALLQIRAQASVCGFSPDHIVLCGFSAGAHLCATLGVYWDHPEVTGSPPKAGLRPAALILGYPVITMGTFAHPGSRRMLTGCDPRLAEEMSLERHVTPRTPPSFVWQTATDEKVPAMNSLLFVQALLAAGVPCEYHLYHHGLHGMSLATEEVHSEAEGLRPDPHIASWVELCGQWLQETI